MNRPPVRSISVYFDACSAASRASRRSSRGVALIIVLAFVVLLTILIVAFFSRAISERQISGASSGQVKVDLLAEGAVNTVIGDLKQEISAGSTVTTGSVSATGTTYTICIPASQAAAVPCESGTINGTPWLPPNLLKRSAVGMPFFSGTAYAISGSSTQTNNFISTVLSGTTATSGTNTVSYPPIIRGAIAAPGSTVLSTTIPSLNGRYVSMQRWNKPLLLSATTGVTTPLTSGTMADGSNWAFAAPDWILVERSGTNPASNTPISNLTWSPTNSTTVVGRYAYNIYDEGGLLDMNVAGHPSSITGTTTSVRNTLAMADLTQIGLISSDIDAIVTNVRNKGTLTESGNFRDNMLNLSATNGFLGVNPATVGDTAFPSRQSLINFLLQGVATDTASRNRLQTALQYMGTFSRSVEQPSFTPNPSRPRITGSAAADSSVTNSYQGNNDAWGQDDLMNPAFLSVRVSSTFQRLDGSAAQIGEPLVKKRFPLSRLSWITYQGPSATASQAQTNLKNVGVSQATISSGSAGAVYNAFGLTWTGSDWNYYHGSAHILPLQQVAALTGANAREPDFAELLKAAIVAGSLAKAAPNLLNNAASYQMSIDDSLDTNVLQIMANLINQVAPDSYPAVIHFGASSSPPLVVRGYTDVPYFYKFVPFCVVSSTPSPMLSTSSSAVFALGDSLTVSGAPAPANVTGSAGTSVTLTACGPGTLSSTGSAYLFYVPILWNPHDQNTLLTSAAARPTKYQIVLISGSPTSPSAQWQSSAQTYPNTGLNTSSTTQKVNLVPSPFPFVSGSSNVNGAMQFNDGSGSIFREPTLLFRPGGACSLTVTSGTTVTDPLTIKSYCGIPIGVAPIAEQAVVTGTVTSGGTKYTGTNNFIIQSSNITYNQPQGALIQFTFRLQYLNAQGNWETYDEVFTDNHNLTVLTLNLNKQDPNGLFDNILMNGQMGPVGNSIQVSGVHDPRMSRFGSGLNNNWLGYDSSTGAPNSSSQYPTGYVLDSMVPSVYNWSTANQTFNFSMNNPKFGFTVIETDRPRASLGSYVVLSNPCMTQNPGQNVQMRWLSGIDYYINNDAPLQFDGLLSQNDPSIVFSSRDGKSNAMLCYEDPDGVVRRAMGAYASTALSGTNTAGMPLATSGTFANGALMTCTPTAQAESRPMILHRPFRSVGEMSYASRGLPWKNIDFFTPESGDTALLDTFCINELPASNLVAGKVNLNTHQPPVLQAMISGACEDEYANLSKTPASMALSGTVSVTEAGKAALAQVTRTLNAKQAQNLGPIGNIGEIVGRFVTSTTSTPNDPDNYVYLHPNLTPSSPVPPFSSGTYYEFSGLSTDLSGTAVFTSSTTSMIQRGRESVIRALADTGQSRVWNLMIDVIAQSGRYPVGTSSFSNFQVEGEKRYWVHLAIDRLTGAVIDKQVEVVTE